MDARELDLCPRGCVFQFAPINSLTSNHTVFYKSCCMCPEPISHLNHQLRLAGLMITLFLCLFDLFMNMFLFSTDFWSYIMTYHYHKSSKSIWHLFFKPCTSDFKYVVAYVNVTHHIYSFLTPNNLFCHQAMS